MNLNQQLLKKMFLSASKYLKQKKDYLSEIDSKFGDGDHGITINKIADLIEKEINNWKQEGIRDFIETLGDKIMGVNGGSAGPLYGTMIGGMAEYLDIETEITPQMFKLMLKGMLENMQDITTAKVGDKTMMDALIPAVKAGIDAEDDIEAIAFTAAQAAKQGAKESEKFVSKFGRAKSYKEQTIGTPDAGAVSTALFFEGFAKGIK